MKTFGLIGYPISHSFSAKYFEEKFRNEKIIDAGYKHFPLKTIDELAPLIENTPQLAGLNVTIPYKETVITYLNELEDEAKEIGAVNTIKISRQPAFISRDAQIGRPCLKGFNTDVYGFKKSITPLLKRNHKKALILGTGGGAKAVGYVLKQLGIEYLFVTRVCRDETPSRLNPAPGTPSRLNLVHDTQDQISYHDLNEDALKTHHLIINATPLGMHPNTKTHPGIPYGHLTGKHLLYDLVYNPTETEFLKLGRQRGAVVINGLEMLKLQAEKSWEIWNKLDL